MKLIIVGARRTRRYEIEYLQRVEKAVADDPRIELCDVTDDVDTYYRKAHCLLCTSLNEVTPMVISEAMSWGKICINPYHIFERVVYEFMITSFRHL